MIKKSSTSQSRQFAESNYAEDIRALAADKKRILSFADDVVFGGAARDEAESRLFTLISSANFFTIDPQRAQDRLLADAFEMAELDPSDPRHWRILLEAMAETTLKRKGANPKWTETEYFFLNIDIQELKKCDPSLTNNLAIARELRARKPFKEKYQARTVDNLRKRVSEAQDPTVNSLAAYRIGDDLNDFIAKQRSAQTGLPEKLTRAFVQRIVDEETDECLKFLERKISEAGKILNDADCQALRATIEEAAKERRRL